ncbi:MAG TPA: PDZ domain-containing protein [Acidobacteria bacterium]|nr:PDZ domain-containing protein [Acidobacteriota bacterium]
MACNKTVVLGVMISALAIGAAAQETVMLPLGDPSLAYQVGSATAGQFYDCAAGKGVDLQGAVERLAGARVVLIGEDHTNMDEKRVQAELLKALAGRMAHPVLGMEFFQRGDDAVLARWTSGELTGDDFLLTSGWYDRGGYNWVYYAPIMDAARELGMPVVGLNVDRSIPRTVNRKGLEGLSPEQKAEVGEVRTDNSPQHRFLIARYFGDTVALLPPAWFDRMYAAQCLWDVVMARSVLAKLPPDGTMIVLVGSGHVAYGLGIARRIHEELARKGQPDISVATLVPVIAPAPEEGGEPHGHPMPGGGHGPGAGSGPPALFVRSLADVVAVFPNRGDVEEVPRLGLKLEEKDGAITVKRVWPETASEEAGVAKGDVITDLNGFPAGDIHHFRLALARLRWGDRMDLRVQRDGKAVDCSVLLEPELETVTREVAPGFKVEEAAALDPASAEPVKAAVKPDPKAEVHRTLILKKDVPQRVEVRHGKVLTAVHVLDPKGHVVRSLYRDPLHDGTVEIEYHRDADGAVTSIVRRDRAGQTIPFQTTP